MKKDFKYETHTHTKESSACAKWTAVECVTAYKDAGYTGIIVTNHFFYGNTCISRQFPWSNWVHGFCKGYNLAKDEGDRIGFQVFFGWESGYKGTDFLIYGLDEDWLLAHPEIRDASIEEQYRIIHEAGGLVVHAHPFRESSYIKEVRLFPEYVDAVEGYNTTHNAPESKMHRNPVFNSRAINYAKKNNLPITSGSDSHFMPIINGGMVFDHKLADINDFINCVKKGDDYRLLTGVQGESLTPKEAFERNKNFKE